MKTNNLKVTIVAVILPLTASLLLGEVAVTQLPTNGVVVGGEATISPIPSVMTINQGTNRAVINWDTFNIGSSATVNINQPSTSSVLHNRVLDNNPSQIFGKINANGQVFLSNPNGVYFSPTASVNVGGLVATTATISLSDFMGGVDIFTQNGVTGSVINDGNLEASLGGYIALLSPTVRNNGVIIAQMGTVVLAGGDSYKLQFSGNILNAVEVTASEIEVLVENGNAIYAPNGLIILSAQAAHTIQSGIIGNTGVINASGVSSNGGVIRLFASQAISNSGEIRADGGDIGDGGVVDIISDLSNPNSQTNIGGIISAKGGLILGDGGKIETSGSRVFIDDLASISTYATNGRSGKWTIDPNDFTVGVGGNMIGSAVESALLGGNFSIISSNGSTSSGAGDININDSISWSANEFSLIAAHSINVNAIMNATGSSTLVMNTSTTNGVDTAIAGGLVNMGLDTDDTFKGQINFDRVGSGFLSIDGNDYTVINNFGLAGSVILGDFQAMSATGNYALGTNLDAEAISTNGISSFSGNFNGLGHTINKVEISSIVSSGLFQSIGIDSVIQNIGLIGGLVEGGVGSGGLIGTNNGNVYNSFNTGDVLSVYAGQGGLIGTHGGGIISNSYATGNVVGAAGTGGLVGTVTTGTVSNSFATGNVVGAAGTGGLVGTIATGSLVNNYATGDVIGAAGTGGLVGTSTGLVSVNYATGIVDGDAGVGGLIGTTTGLTQNSYATGSVSGDSSTGGLIGSTTAGVQNSYSIGVVTSAPLATTGAFIGTATATNSNNFFDSSANGVMVGVGTTSVIGGLTGLSTEELGIQENLTSWDFSDIWMSVSGNIPYLKPLMTPLILSGDSFTTPYTASAIAGSSTYSITPISALAGVLSYSYLSDGITTTTSPINAGSYTVTPTGLLSTQQYLISFASGEMVIGKAPLSVSGTNNEVTYTSNLQTNTGATYSGNVGSDSFTISGYATGTNYNATPYEDTLSISGSALSNYDISYTNGSLAIGKAPLGISNETAIYSDSTILSGSNGSYTLIGLMGSDIGTTVNSATVNNTDTTGNYFTSVTLANEKEANYKLFIGSNETPNINTMNTVTLHYEENPIDPIEESPDVTISPTTPINQNNLINNMLISEILQEISISKLNYKENLLGVYGDSFNKLAYPESFNTKESILSNYVITNLKGKVRIDKKP